MTNQEKLLTLKSRQSSIADRLRGGQSITRLATVVVILVFVLCVDGVRTLQAQEIDDIPVDHSKPELYAQHMAIKFQCHFTVEYLSGSDSFDTSKQDLNPDVSSIDDLVKEFEQKANLRVIVNRQDKKHLVIHLIDKTLGKKSEVLDRKIDFKFSGKAGDIAAAMEKQGIPIGPPRSGAYSGGIIGTDHVTKVTIDVKQTSIREILSFCVDLDMYNRTIWTAETLQAQDGTWKTQIRFTGPRSIRSVR